MLDRSQTIDAISTALKKFPEVVSYLFGSSARGDYNNESDIDILILLPDYLSSRQRVEMECEICGALLPIELQTEIPISPVILPNRVWSKRVTPFTINVTKDRILL